MIASVWIFFCISIMFQYVYECLYADDIVLQAILQE